jgi:hypothetical protein
MTREEKQVWAGLLGAVTIYVVGKEVNRRRKIKRAQMERIASIQRIIVSTETFLTDLKFDKIVQDY